MKFFDPELQFDELLERWETSAVVIHHTDGNNDVDFSAEDVHRMHIEQDYAGCGYHYIVRKDGTVERGRPDWAVGAHAVGHNYYTVGICLSGDFNIAQPTTAQLDALTELISDVCKKFGINITRDNVLGHCELNATSCPGDNLFRRLADIVTRARDPYAYFAGVADVGASYGVCKFDLNTALKFVEWLKSYPDDALANYGRHLAAAKNFDGEWQMIATVDPGHFTQLQKEFAATLTDCRCACANCHRRV